MQTVYFLSVGLKFHIVASHPLVPVERRCLGCFGDYWPACVKPQWTCVVSVGTESARDATPLSH